MLHGRDRANCITSLTSSQSEFVTSQQEEIVNRFLGILFHTRFGDGRTKQLQRTFGLIRFHTDNDGYAHNPQQQAIIKIRYNFQEFFFAFVIQLRDKLKSQQYFLLFLFLVEWHR